MNDSTLDPGILVFVDRQTKAETAVIAILAEDEFKRAQTIFPELSAYRGFEEWRESREGLQMGLAMAGVAAKMVPVFLAPPNARLTPSPRRSCLSEARPNPLCSPSSANSSSQRIHAT